MQDDKATGLESTDSPQGTIPTASTTSRLPPLSEEEALLHWAEERLIGQYGECPCCSGDGWDPYTEAGCGSCEGEGTCVRQDYLDAETALTLEQRRVIGRDQLLTVVYDGEDAMFKLVRGV